MHAAETQEVERTGGSNEPSAEAGPIEDFMMRLASLVECGELAAYPPIVWWDTRAGGPSLITIDVPDDSQEQLLVIFHENRWYWATGRQAGGRAHDPENDARPFLDKCLEALREAGIQFSTCALSELTEMMQVIERDRRIYCSWNCDCSEMALEFMTLSQQIHLLTARTYAAEEALTQTQISMRSVGKGRQEVDTQIDPLSSEEANGALALHCGLSSRNGRLRPHMDYAWKENGICKSISGSLPQPDALTPEQRQVTVLGAGISDIFGRAAAALSASKRRRPKR